MLIPKTAADWRTWNSRNHDGAGQNVLYNDGHVSWAETPRCGVNGDNIFCWGPRPGSTREFMGAGPPTHPLDCVMVPASPHGWN